MTAVETRQHRHPQVTEHRHPTLLPTISEESRSSPRRQSKPDWPWDSDDEEYIENAPPQTDAHARLGWEIAEYRERRHLGDSDAPDDELYAVPAETLPNVRTPTILVTPPPASTPPPLFLLSPNRSPHRSPQHGARNPQLDVFNPIGDPDQPGAGGRAVTPLDIGASLLERAEALLHPHTAREVFHPTPIPWSHFDPSSTIPSPFLPPCPSPSPSSSSSVTPSQSVSWWRNLWNASPGPRISPFEWDSPSPRFEPGLQFGEWGDWGQSAGGSRGLSPNLEAVSPRSAKFDLSAPLCGEGMPSLTPPLRSSHERRFSDPSLRQPRFSDPDEWYSCHSSGGSFGMLDVQRRSVDVQAIACWRLDVFEECGGWPGRAAPVGVLESYGSSAVRSEGETGRIGGEEGSVRDKGVRE